jgi:hypothetical protein
MTVSRDTYIANMLAEIGWQCWTTDALERFQPDCAVDPGRFARGTALRLLAMARHVASNLTLIPSPPSGEGSYLHPSPSGRRDGDEGWRLVPRANRLGLASHSQAESALAARGARYPKFEWSDEAVRKLDAVLLSTEPYRFTEAHVDALEQQIGKPVRLVDGEMMSWYGSRAIRGLRYLQDLATSCG